MVTVSELQARVTSDFERLNLPSWLDPHPGRVEPAEEEYSRLTNPERYGVVHARARAWAAALEDALGVGSEVLQPASFALGGRPEAFDRGVRLSSGRPATLPLLLLEQDVPTRSGDGDLAVLHIGVVRPDVVIAMQPDCGCDACDSGSIDLLEAIDATIRQVVGGPFVVLRGSDWSAEWSPDGGSASGVGRRQGFRELMDLCRRLAEGEPMRLPKGTEAFVGRSWLS